VCRRALSLMAFLLLVAMAGANDASPTSVSKHIRDIRMVCLINTNADLEVFDKLSAEVQDWGRWKIVEKPDQADLLLVLSQSRETDFSTLHPREIYELYAPYQWPMADQPSTLRLTAIDRSTGRQLLTVSCARHHFPPASQWLVSRLRKKVAALEKSGR